MGACKSACRHPGLLDRLANLPQKITMATEESVQAEELQEAPGPSEVRLPKPPALWRRTEWSTASCGRI